MSKLLSSSFRNHVLCIDGKVEIFCVNDSGVKHQ